MKSTAALLGFCTLALLPPAQAHAGEIGASAQPGREEVVIAVPETVELAFILAALSDLAREEGGQIDRDSAYFRAVETHFAPYADLPALADLPAQFNLPRLAGNAADFAFDEAGRIVEIDTSGSLWGDAEGDRFRAMREEIESFAQASDFRAFYESQSDVYQSQIDAVTRMVDPQDMSAWLTQEFSAQPAPIRIYVSPLTSGLHWTTLFKPEQRMWLKAPSAERLDEATALDRMRFARSVFTELDHGYVNPVSARLIDQVETAFADTAQWVSTGAAGQYPTAELQFNEYMTWAVFLLYAAERLSPADYAELEPQIIGFMERGRGFIEFGAFTRELIARRAETGRRAEDLIPLILDWCAGYEPVSAPLKPAKK